MTTFMAILKLAKYPKVEQQSVSEVVPEQFGIYQQLTGTFEHEAFADLPFLGYSITLTVQCACSIVLKISEMYFKVMMSFSFCIRVQRHR